MTEIALTLVFGYAALVAGIFCLQRRMMYFPDPATPDPEACTTAGMSVVSYTAADRQELSAWNRRPTAAGRPSLICFHANAGHFGDRLDKVRPYLAAGFGVLLAGYRGYGGNPGKPSEAGLYADGRAALAWLRARGVGDGGIVLYGESLGTGVAVHLAAERAVGAVVLEAPFSSIVDVATRRYWYLPVRLLLRDRFESAAKIARIAAPILILHSDDDPVVPPALSEKLFAAARPPKEARRYAGAGHTGFDAQRADRDVIAFLKRHMRWD